MLAFVAGLVAMLLIGVARGTPATHWLVIKLEDITDLENRSDKPCKPEVELKRTQLHPEGEMVPNGWAECEKVRLKFRAITVIH